MGAPKLSELLTAAAQGIVESHRTGYTLSPAVLRQWAELAKALEEKR